MRRSFDVIVATVALVFLSPVLLGATVAVIVGTGRPVFFKHERIGLGGVPFDVFKFRTMTAAPSAAPEVTASSDSRITAVGRVLRNYKIDELPQLLNVIRGEMSLVGPRPEVARYVDSRPELFTVIHSVRPGITDPSSVAFRNEEELLGAQKDPEAYYISELLPAKAEMSSRYIESRSLRSDLTVIARTIGSLAR